MLQNLNQRHNVLDMNKDQENHFLRVSQVEK